MSYTVSTFAQSYMSKNILIRLNAAGIPQNITVRLKDNKTFAHLTIQEFKDMMQSGELQYQNLKINKAGNIECTLSSLLSNIEVITIPVELPKDKTITIDKLIYERYKHRDSEEYEKFIKEAYISSQYDNINKTLENLGGEKVHIPNIGHPTYKFKLIQLRIIVSNSYKLNKPLTEMGIYVESNKLVIDTGLFSRKSPKTILEEDSTDQTKLNTWINKAKLLGIYGADKILVDESYQTLKGFNTKDKIAMLPPVKNIDIKENTEVNTVTEIIKIPDTVESICLSLNFVNYKKLKQVDIGENLLTSSISSFIGLKATKVNINNLMKHLNISNIHRLKIKPHAILNSNNFNKIKIIEIEL